MARPKVSPEKKIYAVPIMFRQEQIEWMEKNNFQKHKFFQVQLDKKIKMEEQINNI